MYKILISFVVAAGLFVAPPSALAWNIWSDDNSRVVGTLPDETVRAAQEEAQRRNTQTTYPRGTLFHDASGVVIDVCPLWFPTYFFCVLVEDE